MVKDFESNKSKDRQLLTNEKGVKDKFSKLYIAKQLFPIDICIHCTRKI